jgi:hypothetical protein
MNIEYKVNCGISQDQFICLLGESTMRQRAGA